MSIKVYRIQDDEGRGPFRPGIPPLWADDNFSDGVHAMPSWGEEFGWDLLRNNGKPGENFGSAVLGLDQMRKWFSATEARRMEKIGYALVSMRVPRLIASSANQVVFARRRPLNEGVTILPWADLYDFRAVA